MGWADSYTLRKVAREIDRKHQAGNLSLSLPLSYQFAHFLYLCTVSSQGALFFSFLFSFSVLIVIQGSSIVITHQMLSRHFIVFFSFFSFTLFPPPQSESLYHPFWCFCFFLCGPLSILLFPPSVNAVIAVRGSIGRDGEKWKKHEEGGALLLVTSWIVWGGVGWVCGCVWGGEIVKGVVLLWQWDLLCVRLPRQLQAYTWYRHHHHPTPPPTPSATWLQGEHFTLCMRSLMHPHTGNA